jgi:hypothetical protein
MRLIVKCLRPAILFDLVYLLAEFANKYKWIYVLVKPGAREPSATQHLRDALYLHQYLPILNGA